MAVEMSVSVVCLLSSDAVDAASCSSAYAYACDEQTTTGSSGHQGIVAMLESQRARCRCNYVDDDAENICKRSSLTPSWSWVGCCGIWCGEGWADGGHCYMYVRHTSLVHKG